MPKSANASFIFEIGRFGCNAANAIFASWMAIGNILGYSSGSTGKWHKYVYTFFEVLLTKYSLIQCSEIF